jgi:hypothetical protein
MMKKFRADYELRNISVLSILFVLFPMPALKVATPEHGETGVFELIRLLFD